MYQVLITLVALASIALSGYAIPKLQKTEVALDVARQDISSLQSDTLQLGSQNAVGGGVYYLSGSGVSSSASSIGLTKFGYTQPNGVYAKFTMTNFGDLGCVTIQPGNVSGKQEFASFTGITQSADGTATLSGVSRGLERYEPFSASTTLQTAHAGGSDVVVSNSPPCFYQNYAATTQNESITGQWTFSSAPIDSGTSTSTSQFATRGYANSLSYAGTATSTTAVAGIGFLATGAQAAAGTNSLMVPNFLSALISTSTYFGDGSNNKVIVTKTNGSQANTIDPNFIATSSSYNWTGLNTHVSELFTGSTTFSGAPIVFTGTSASTTFASPINFNGNVYMTKGLTIGTASTTASDSVVISGLASTTNLIVSKSTTLGSWEKITASANLNGASPSTVTVSASCTGSKQVVGGGGYGAAVAATYGILASYPSNNTTWTVIYVGQNGGTDSITAYAICI